MDKPRIDLKLECPEHLKPILGINVSTQSPIFMCLKCMQTCNVEYLEINEIMESSDQLIFENWPFKTPELISKLRKISGFNEQKISFSNIIKSTFTNIKKQFSAEIESLEEQFQKDAAKLEKTGSQILKQYNDGCKKNELKLLFQKLTKMNKSEIEEQIRDLLSDTRFKSAQFEENLFENIKSNTSSIFEYSSVQLINGQVFQKFEIWLEDQLSQLQIASRSIKIEMELQKYSEKNKKELENKEEILRELKQKLIIQNDEIEELGSKLRKEEKIKIEMENEIEKLREHQSNEQRKFEKTQETQQIFIMDLREDKRYQQYELDKEKRNFQKELELLKATIKEKEMSIENQQRLEKKLYKRLDEQKEKIQEVNQQQISNLISQIDAQKIKIDSKEIKQQALRKQLKQKSGCGRRDILYLSCNNSNCNIWCDIYGKIWYKIDDKFELISQGYQIEKTKFADKDLINKKVCGAQCPLCISLNRVGMMVCKQNEKKRGNRL